MQLRIGDDIFDLDARPLVIARPSSAALGDDDLVRLSKDAVGDGADLVEIARCRLDEQLTGVLSAAGIRILARPGPTDGPGEPAVALDVTGPLDRSGAGSADPVRFSSDPTRLRPGDGQILTVTDLDPLGRLDPGIVGIVDLCGMRSRAELAAVVAWALGMGAGGFITTEPMPVRRAAHVIRAVEHAR